MDSRETSVNDQASIDSLSRPPPRETGLPSLRVRQAAFAVLLPFIVLAVVRMAGLRTGENSYDCFYHIRMADLGPSVYLARTFPPTHLSMWSEHFSDKELLFHVFLSVVRHIESLCGISDGPPFHLPGLLCMGAILVSFVLALRGLGVRRHLWVWSSLLAGISPFFTHRMLLIRPHTFSIALMLLACPILNRIRRRRHLWFAVALGFLLSWTHSNPHFVVLPAAAFAAVRFRKDPLLAFGIPLSAVAGIVAGYTLHPQFPNTFLLWKVQCVDVLLKSLVGGKSVDLGGELSPPGPAWWGANILVPTVAVLSLLLFRRLYREHHLTRGAIAIQLLAGISLVATLAGQRGMEYACPYVILSCAVNVALSLDRKGRKRTSAGLRLKAWLPALALVILLGGAVQRYRVLRKTCIEPFADFGRWACAAGLPPGTGMANLVWHEFPLLFFSAPHLCYSFGLDPMFSYVYRPDAFTRLSEFRTGRSRLPAAEVRELTEAHYLFLSRWSHALAKALFSQGFACVYQGPDGWVFDLEYSADSQTSEEGNLRSNDLATPRSRPEQAE